MSLSDPFDNLLRSEAPPPERSAPRPSEARADRLNGSPKKGVLTQALLCAAEVMPNALLLTDPHQPDNPIVYYNSAFARLTGYSHQEIMGHNPRFLQGLDTAPEDVARIREAIQQEKSIQMTILNYKKDATSFWNEMTIAPVRDADGHLTHFAGVQTDVTALKQEEQEHREADRRLASVLESVSDAVVVLDKSWRYAYVNAKAAQIFSRRPEDMIGKHIWTEFPEGVGQPFYHAYYRATVNQIPIQIEEYYAPDQRWFENRIYPSSQGLSIFFQDVTERRRGEEKLREGERRLAEAQRIARLGSWEWNIRTGEVSWSQELLRMTGWESNRPIPDYKNTWAIVHPEDAARVERELTDAIEKGSAVDFENKLLCPDGREITVHNWGHVVRDEANRPLRLIAVAQDVTEQRRTEAALQETERHLQAVAEAIPASIVISRKSDGAVLYANPFARQLFGVAPEVDLSRYFSQDFYQDPEDRAETVRLLTLNSRVGPRELAVKRLDGTLVFAEGTFRHLIYKGEEAVLATHHDITVRKSLEAERERMLAEALERADRDPLTGLLNHRAFHRRLEEEADRAEREGMEIAVVMLDLDNFKFFNDVHGHSSGDSILRQVAQRLGETCRPYDTLARFGGD